MLASAAPEKIFVSWEQYFELLHTLFAKIRASDFVPQQIICVARGGLIPGELASRTFRVPLAVLSVASYPDQTTQQETITFSRDLTTAKPLRRTGILLMDDLTETGTTLEMTDKWLRWWYSIEAHEIRTATVWHKEWSKFTPDFYARRIAKDPITGAKPWIVQPQESFCR